MIYSNIPNVVNNFVNVFDRRSGLIQKVQINNGQDLFARDRKIENSM